MPFIDMGSRMDGKVTRRQIKKDAPFHLMTLPAVILTIVFCYVPMFGIIIAFKKFNFRQGFFGSPWVGLEYFGRFFTDVSLPPIIINSAVLGIMGLVFGTIANLGFALLLNELTNLRIKKLFKQSAISPTSCPMSSLL